MGGYSQMALLDPNIIGGDSGEDENDPRQRLLKMMSLTAMKQLAGDREPDSAGGEHDTLANMTGDQASDHPSLMPAGFDQSTGMPTEYPATAAKNAAASRLQKAQDFNQPGGLKKDLFRGALTMAPALIGLGGGGAGAAGAAQGASEAADKMYGRGVQEREFAAGQYQFEAGREERERDQAIREKVAMAQIEANKAYRTLMASISEQRAKTGEVNSETNAQGKGLTVQRGSNGVNQVVPLLPDQLSTLNKAKLGVEQAQADLANAHAKAVPQQIEIAKDRLKIQQEMLQKALAELGLSQWKAEMQRESLDFRETGPTMQTKSMAQMGRITEPHIKNFDDLVTEADKRGYIGPAAGRVYGEFLAGRVGSTGDRGADELLGKILEQESLFSGALSRTHMGGRPAAEVWKKFQNDLRMGQAANILHSRLSTIDEYISGYGTMDQWTPIGGRAAGPPSPAQRLKRGQPGSSGDMPPAGARVRDYTQLGGTR